MGSKTDYYENICVNAALNPAGASLPANTWVGLYDTFTTPETSTGLTEVADANYDRHPVAAGDFPAASGGTADNDQEISFTSGLGMAAPGGADGWFIADAATAGNILLHDAFAARETWGIGDDPKFAAGELDYTED